MFKWVDHVVIAVNSLDEAIPDYEKKLGLKLGRRGEIANQGVNMADFFLDGTRYIELIEPKEGVDGGVARGLKARGEGVWLLALAVEDMEQAKKQLKENGAQLVEAGGAAFVHPKSTHGVLIQLIEKKEAS